MISNVASTAGLPLKINDSFFRLHNVKRVRPAWVGAQIKGVRRLETTCVVEKGAHNEDMLQVLSTAKK